MKNLVLVLLFIIFPSYLMSADTLDGMLGIKFGSSIEDARSIMLQKKVFSPNSENIENKSGDLIYTSGKFAGRDVDVLLLDFIDNKFSGGAIFFSATLESQVIDNYESIRNEINQKYHESDVNIENFKYPYEAGDDHTETAIKLGYAKFMTGWNFDEIANEEYKSSIILSITDDLTIMLLYRDNILSGIKSEREKSVIMEDY